MGRKIYLIKFLSSIQKIIDHSAGVTLKKKMGDYVKENEVLAILHCNFEINEDIKNELLSAYLFADKPVNKNPYVYEIIS